jgi:PAS domain S-box-containing protein
VVFLTEDHFPKDSNKSVNFNPDYSRLVNLNKEWEQTFNALPDLIAIIDLDHRIKKVNKAMADRLHGKPEDFVGSSCFSLVHGTKEPPDFCPHLDLLKDMKTHIKQFPIELLQGDFLVSTSPIFDDEGQLMGSVHVVHDITERNKLEESSRLLAAIVESSDDAIIGKDLTGKITSWNRAAEKMYGYSKKETIGKSISILVPSQIEDDLDQIMRKIKNGESLKQYETLRRKKNGKFINVSLFISPILDSDGNIIGASTIAHDITQRKRMKEDLKESEEKYKELFDNANDMISLNEMKENGLPGNFIEVNKIGIERLGYSREELLKMNPRDLVAPDQYPKMPINAEELQNKGSVQFKIVQLTKDGKRIHVENNNHLYEHNGKKVILAISRNIMEREKAEKDLRDSESKFRKIFENIQDIFYQTDNNGIIIEISPSIERYSGYKPSELIGKPVEMIYLNPEDRSTLLKEIFENGEVVDYEIKLKTKTNTVLYVSVNSHILFDSNNNPIGIEGSLRNIDERKNMEIQLKKSLDEKEMLLKEIHHRVKNNLMIISSLLNLQSRYIKDKASQNIFKESQNRARSMALIHERLYQSTDLKKIDFGDYIQTLSNELFNTYVSDPSLVKLKINVNDIMLDINTSIPLGLIVNELITNSIKHAFPDGRNGEINIDFHTKDDYYEFIVKDNGIGFPEDLDFRNTDSLGLLIVNSLTEQIDGKIELDKFNGTEFKITFKELEI